ncbi:MAG: TIGR02530 family flagellar biosynthesis protein [Actinomycetota bacterium]
MSTDPRTAGVTGVAAVGTTPAAPTGRKEPPAAGFDRMLARRLDGAGAPEPLRWSAHARERLVQRRIAITPDVHERLEGAVAKAAAKGARESLVMVDDMAFVVSVKNRVVITAVDRAGMKDQVFSNIDSAVLS